MNEFEQLPVEGVGAGLLERSKGRALTNRREAGSGCQLVVCVCGGGGRQLANRSEAGLGTGLSERSMEDRDERGQGGSRLRMQ